MAEEIIHEWKGPHNLVVDLMSKIDGRFDVSKELLNLAVDDPTAITGFQFTFLDARGNRVEFPLKLVSDTTITRTSPPLPTEPEQSS